jgi:hypothetical protein
MLVISVTYGENGRVGGDEVSHYDTAPFPL